MKQSQNRHVQNAGQKVNTRLRPGFCMTASERQSAKRTFWSAYFRKRFNAFSSSFLRGFQSEYPNRKSPWAYFLIICMPCRFVRNIIRSNDMFNMMSLSSQNPNSASAFSRELTSCFFFTVPHKLRQVRPECPSWKQPYYIQHDHLRRNFERIIFQSESCAMKCFSFFWRSSQIFAVM